jgi:hypothetical protein
MLNANYAFLAESLYNKMRVMLGEYRALNPKVTFMAKGKTQDDRLLIKEVEMHDC